MSTAPTACDTSVLLPAIVQWHPRHEAARAAVRSRVTAVPGHVILECFSVLTRLPAPHRVSAADAQRALTGLAMDTLALPPEAYLDIVRQLAAAGLRGGTVYDGLVAATAHHHRHTLLTSDRRARVAYEAMGARFETL